MKDNYLYIAALCFAGYDLKRKDAKKLLRLLSQVKGEIVIPFYRQDGVNVNKVFASAKRKFREQISTSGIKSPDDLVSIDLSLIEALTVATALSTLRSPEVEEEVSFVISGVLFFLSSLWIRLFANVEYETKIENLSCFIEDLEEKVISAKKKLDHAKYRQESRNYAGQK